MSEDLGKRQRKPKVAYEPADFRIKKERRESGPQDESSRRKTRNQAVDDTANKWKAYYNVIKKGVDIIVREDHFVEVRSQTAGPDAEKEIQKSQQKIKEAKKAILKTFQAIDLEVESDRQWSALAEGDEEDMVDVNDVLCSTCQGEEQEGNDILFCDRAGCYRAYHQLCLEPRIDLDSMDMDRDWFCWHCECLDDALDYLGERLGCECREWGELFPSEQGEVRQGEGGEGGDTLQGVLLPDEEEEGDEEYHPGEREGEEEEEGEEEGEWEDMEEGEGREEGEREELGGEGEEEGGEGEGEGGEEEEESEEEEEDWGEESELESEIDAEEVQGLLGDVPPDLPLPLPSLSQGGRQLRPRTSSQREDVVVRGRGDVGRGVAKVVRGVVVRGEVKGVECPLPLPEDAMAPLPAELRGEVRWVVSYPPSPLLSLSYDELLPSLRLFQELSEREGRKKEREEQRRLLLALGGLSEGNIVGGKRERGAVDYHALSLQMFGSLHDEEDWREGGEGEGEGEGGEEGERRGKEEEYVPERRGGRGRGRGKGGARRGGKEREKERGGEGGGYWEEDRGESEEQSEESEEESEEEYSEQRGRKRGRGRPNTGGRVGGRGRGRGGREGGGRGRGRGRGGKRERLVESEEESDEEEGESVELFDSEKESEEEEGDGAGGEGGEEEGDGGEGEGEGEGESE